MENIQSLLISAHRTRQRFGHKNLMALAVRFSELLRFSSSFFLPSMSNHGARIISRRESSPAVMFMFLT